MHRLKSKSVLVTGAARGIGEEIAIAAAEEGASVTAVDQSAAGLRQLAERAAAADLSLQVLECDVTKAEDNHRAVAAAERRFGPLSVFIANAAIIRFSDALSTTEEDWEAIHTVNLKGVHFGVQAALPSLTRAGGGSLILIASVLGIVGDPLLPAYGATKGGLRALCRSLAVRYGAQNIRCNTICPGDVETEMLRAQLERDANPEAARAAILKHYALGRFARPRDVANAAVFLASDEAAYITGTDLVVDGGLLARCY